MPLIPLLIASLGALFVGSQLDDAIENATKPVGSTSNFSLPLFVTLPALIALSAAAFFLVRRALK